MQVKLPIERNKWRFWWLNDKNPDEKGYITCCRQNKVYVEIVLLAKRWWMYLGYEIVCVSFTGIDLVMSFCFENWNIKLQLHICIYTPCISIGLILFCFTIYLLDQIKVIGSYGARARQDLPKLIKLAESGIFNLRAAVSRKCKFEEAAEAYKDLDKGNITGRAVVEIM